MSRNLSYGLKLIRDEVCFRVGNKVMVKRNNTMVTPDLRPMLNAGLVLSDPASGRVTITLDGLLKVRTELNYRTRKNAMEFIGAHDSFYIMDGMLRATDGGCISRYVADFLIEEGVLVLRPDGRYGKAVTLIEVGPGEVAAVREFLRCLRSVT